jgi:hypothetical protein
MQIADNVLRDLQHGLLDDGERREAELANERAKLAQRLQDIRRRQEFVHRDRLDGKIKTEFWRARAEELN